MKIQPKTAPIDHMGVDRPNAKKKFSVLIENKSALQITFTLFLGCGKTETIILPTKVAIPTAALTIPSDISPPLSLDNIIAGKAALYIEAIRLIDAKNKIKSNIPLFAFRYFSPDFADCISFSFSASSYLISGIFINSNRHKNAILNVNRSNSITTFIPPKDKKAVAIIGVRTLVREFEKDLSPLTF
jgi:hypothetical protein